MIVCSNCQHEQDGGKFCESCGQPLQENTPPNTGPQVESTQVHDESNQNSEKIKHVLGTYWSYFLQLLKNPTRAFHLNENKFGYGLVTMGLYVLFIAFAVYLFVNSTIRSFGGIFSETVSLPFSIVLEFAFVMLVFIAISFLSAFIMIKIAKNKQDFKTLIAQYGGLLVPFTLLHAISLIGGMISSLTLTFIPLFISLILSITFLPVIFVYEKVAIVRPNNQKVYLSLATVIVMSILFYIVGEAFLMNMIEEFERFDMYW